MSIPNIQDLKIFYFPVIKNENIFDAKLSSNENNIPISIIGLLSSEDGAYKTGYLDLDGNSAHADIHTFLSLFGSAETPPDKFGFDYLSNFSISSYTAGSGEYASNFIDLSGTKGKVITISEVSGSYQPIKVSINDAIQKYPYAATLYYHTNTDECFLNLIGNYEIRNNTIARTINYNFNLSYVNKNIKNYKQKINESFTYSGTNYFDSNDNLVSSTKGLEPTRFDQKGIFYCDDNQESNGIRIAQGNKDIGEIDLRNYFTSSVQDNTNTLVFVNNSLPIAGSSTELYSIAYIKGTYDFTNTQSNLKTEVYFDAKKDVLLSSGTKDYVTSVSSLNLPIIKTESGANLQRAFLKLMIDFYSNSSSDPSLKFVDHINSELSKKSDLHRAIIIDLISNCKSN